LTRLLVGVAALWLALAAAGSALRQWRDDAARLRWDWYAPSDAILRP
jgi:hypothetical protein